MTGTMNLASNSSSVIATPSTEHIGAAWEVEESANTIGMTTILPLLDGPAVDPFGEGVP
jgi:hypothetical protein